MDAEAHFAIGESDTLGFGLTSRTHQREMINRNCSRRRYTFADGTG